MKNIALLGFGRIGQKYFQTSLKSKYIVINKILKKRKINLKISNVKFFRNFDLLNRDKNIEAYIVATPVESHYEYVSKIVNKNKPFILEKPIVANYEELKKIHKICKNYKHSIFINHIDLYNPTFLAFLKNLKSVGIYKKIDIFFGNYQKIKKFNIRNKKGKFFLPSFDWLPHPLAITIKLAGLPKKISIIKNKIIIKNNYIFQKSKIELQCKKKVVNINFSNGYSTPRRRVKVTGSRAILTYDGYKQNVLIKKNNKKLFRNIIFKKIEPMENFLKYFYYSINNRSNINDIKFGHKVMKILFEIENKIKKKSKILK